MEQDPPRDCLGFVVHVARAVISLGVLSGLLLLLWRLLAETAAGEPFGDHTVRCLPGIGWLVIAGAVMEPAPIHVTSAGQLGYWVEANGLDPQLMPLVSAGYPDGVDLWQIALGGLALLLAAVPSPSRVRRLPARFGSAPTPQPSQRRPGSRRGRPPSLER